ncbi:MAG: hypothetical protein K0Q57_390 [Gammaproteobacteria bacterium]|jgi:hypothetical protein|nr:hypothetical protein [Gammaproteobacteria bacterium]
MRLFSGSSRVIPSSSIEQTQRPTGFGNIAATFFSRCATFCTIDPSIYSSEEGVMQAVHSARASANRVSLGFGGIGSRRSSTLVSDNETISAGQNENVSASFG